MLQLTPHLALKRCFPCSARFTPTSSQQFKSTLFELKLIIRKAVPGIEEQFINLIEPLELEILCETQQIRQELIEKINGRTLYISSVPCKVSMEILDSIDEADAYVDRAVQYFDGVPFDELEPGLRPDTVVVRDLPAKWFELDLSDPSPSELLHQAFSQFGKLRALAVEKSGQGLLVLTVDVFVQFELFEGFKKLISELSWRRLVNTAFPNSWVLLKFHYDKTGYFSVEAAQERAKDLERREQRSIRRSEKLQRRWKKSKQEHCDCVCSFSKANSKLAAVTLELAGLRENSARLVGLRKGAKLDELIGDCLVQGEGLNDHEKVVQRAIREGDAALAGCEASLSHVRGAELDDFRYANAKEGLKALAGHSASLTRLIREHCKRMQEVSKWVADLQEQLHLFFQGREVSRMRRQFDSDCFHLRSLLEQECSQVSSETLTFLFGKPAVELFSDVFDFRKTASASRALEALSLARAAAPDKYLSVRGAAEGLLARQVAFGKAAVQLVSALLSAAQSRNLLAPPVWDRVLQGAVERSVALLHSAFSTAVSSDALNGSFVDLVSASCWATVLEFWSTCADKIVDKSNALVSRTDSAILDLSVLQTPVAAVEKAREDVQAKFSLLVACPDYAEQLSSHMMRLVQEGAQLEEVLQNLLLHTRKPWFFSIKEGNLVPNEWISASVSKRSSCLNEMQRSLEEAEVAFSRGLRCYNVWNRLSEFEEWVDARLEITVTVPEDIVVEKWAEGFQAELWTNTALENANKSVGRAKESLRLVCECQRDAAESLDSLMATVDAKVGVARQMSDMFDNFVDIFRSFSALKQAPRLAVVDTDQLGGEGLAELLKMRVTMVTMQENFLLLLLNSSHHLSAVKKALKPDQPDACAPYLQEALSEAKKHQQATENAYQALCEAKEALTTRKAELAEEQRRLIEVMERRAQKLERESLRQDEWDSRHRWGLRGCSDSLPLTCEEALHLCRGRTGRGPPNKRRRLASVIVGCSVDASAVAEPVKGGGEKGETREAALRKKLLKKKKKKKRGFKE